MDQGSPKLDIILLPGVAFDENFNRVSHARRRSVLTCQLGRGKGYYDRFLQRYCANHPKPLLCTLEATLQAATNPAVALALSPQLLPAGQTVPHDSGDVPLDGIIHPGGIMMREQAHA